MYIIIHKYQRWFVNVETKQKYLKNKPGTNKTTYSNMVRGSKTSC